MLSQFTTNLKGNIPIQKAAFESEPETQIGLEGKLKAHDGKQKRVSKNCFIILESTETNYSWSGKSDSEESFDKSYSSKKQKKI